MNTLHLTLAFCIGTVPALCQQQSPCNVLMVAISGQYTGECHNDKAHGLGKAAGTDSYEGEFKKGYPDGPGTYTWQNGTYFTGNFKKGLKQGKVTIHYKRPGQPDSVVSGFWKKDIYAGLYEKPYEFLNEGQSALLNKRITKQGTKKNSVRFTANRDVLGNFAILNGSFVRKNNGGSLSNIYIEFQDVIFPFRVEFRGRLNRVIDIIFYEEGEWEVDFTFSEDL